jgi:hypothetical protein
MHGSTLCYWGLGLRSGLQIDARPKVSIAFSFADDKPGAREFAKMLTLAERFRRARHGGFVQALGDIGSPPDLYVFKIAGTRPILHEVNRFLYLDADLLVRSSVYPLYEKLTEDTAAAAVRDYYHARKRVAPDILRIVRRGERTVFQCGVMLVNAEAWRNRKVPEQALAYLDLHASTVLHGDQDGGRSERVGSIVECATRRF